MKPESVLAKTQKGAREIDTRENKLDHRLRALLIMVNGRATAGDLAKKFEQIGDISPMLQQLVTDGFIEIPGAAAAAAPQPAAVPQTSAAPQGAPAGGPEQLKQAQVALASQLRSLLGPDADVITEKIEQTRSMAELRAYFSANRGMLDEWLGKTKSPGFWLKVDTLLR